MIFETIDEAAGALPQFTAIAGLDLGTKTIGVAVSDRMMSVATPLETVKRKKFTLDAEAV
ncbi:MAG: Holliday junction resolvase RuvX, partial [Pseudomonadota bacterium]|nr:Holliday junction resolvase RuvX [Pseudomonadota bacterium]